MPSDAPMQWLIGDFETFYSKEYSLTHMDPPSYILDDRFEAICLGIMKMEDTTPMLVDGPVIPDYIDSLRRWQAEGQRIAFISHNALFDACILSWRYGFVPDLIACTLSMARSLLRSHIKSVSLENVARHFGLEKGGTIYKVIGMTRADIIENGLWDEYTRYCLNDTKLCRIIFRKLLAMMPAEELVLQDMILRCAVQPQFVADVDMLMEHHSNVVFEKAKLLMKAAFCGLNSPEELSSNNQFADLLQRKGVKPPRKISPQTGKETWAFSKLDRPFLALLEHDDPTVSTLVEARMAVKSTLEETRAQRLINIAHLHFPHYHDCAMPIPLKMGAAITHRLGGDWDCNPQNWGRKSPIRKAMRAPEGRKVVVADAEQIEARLTCWFCGQHDLVDAFAQGRDVYSDFAASIYHCPVTKETEPTKRFVGKTGVLQLGYQSGWKKFMNMVWLKSFETEPEPIVLTEDEARNIVYGYRGKYSKIKDMWDRLGDLLPEMASNPSFRLQIGPILIVGTKVIAPNGLSIDYHNLRQELDDDGKLNWVYDYSGATYKIYGGKFLENIIQMLARIVVMQAAIRLKPLLSPYHSQLTHTSHDELVYLCNDEDVEAVERLVNREMSTTPAWAHGLPLKTAVSHGQTYGEAK